MKRLSKLALLGVVVAAGFAWMQVHAEPEAAEPTGDGKTLLARLVVAHEDAGAHYVRSEWGESWPSRGGCSVREQVLLDQGAGETRAAGCRPVCPPSSRPCWVSPYDGRATRDPGGLQIDHRVPLGEAARSRVVVGGKPGAGAGRAWSSARKHAYYEDLANLVAVTAALNEGKGDDDPSQWKPPSRAAWCDYATRWIQVKVRYALTADQTERDALAQMLGTCR